MQHGYKTQHTTVTVSDTIIIFIANYIKGYKAYTTYRNHTFRQRPFKPPSHPNTQAKKYIQPYLQIIKQKETLMVTYKAVMRPALEHASSIWSSLASSTSINKLQVMQNTALRTATGCTQDTNIHLYD